MSTKQMSDLPTNVSKKHAGIFEVRNGFVVSISYDSDVTGHHRALFIYTNWNDMMDDLRKWFIGGGGSD